MKLVELSSVYHPTEHERKVLSLVLVCDTPQLAASQSSKSAQLSSARDNLIRLGFLVGDDSQVQISDSGKELCTQQALSDDGISPTDNAQQLASQAIV